MNIDLLKKNEIDVESGIEILGDLEIYNETLNDFLEEMKDRLPQLEEYKEKEDMENYAIIVHAIKGDSKYLGFTKLADISFQHQLKSQANDIKYIKDNYEILITEINRIIEVVNEYLK